MDKRKHIETLFPFLKEKYRICDGMPGYIEDKELRKWLNFHYNTHAYLRFIAGNTMLISADGPFNHLIDIYNFVKQLEEDGNISTKTSGHSKENEKGI